VKKGFYRWGGGKKRLAHPPGKREFRLQKKKVQVNPERRLKKKKGRDLTRD